MLSLPYLTHTNIVLYYIYYIFERIKLSEANEKVLIKSELIIYKSFIYLL